MKVLFLNLIAFSKLHFAEELDLIQRHLDKKDQVYVLRCNNYLKNGCGSDVKKNLIRCGLCICEKNNAYKMMKFDGQIFQIDAMFPVDQNMVFSYDALSDLKEIRNEYCDIGNSVASHLISYYRNPDLKLTPEIHLITDNYLREMIGLKGFLENVIDQHGIEQIYIFNGRLPYYRVALRVAQNKGITAYVHERGWILNKYVLAENTYPHDLGYQKNEIERDWKSEQNFNKKETIARNWYTNYQSGKSKASLSFTEHQKVGFSPTLDRAMINVGIFVSSEDEMVTIEEWKSVLYHNQNDALQKIISYDKWNPNVFFYLRIHPNLSGIHNSQTEFFDRIKWDKMCIIPAESPISTYELINAVDMVLVFGSTVGIEACYFKKPVILAGRALYEDLEGFCKPNSHEELCSCINNYPNCQFDLDKEYESALKFAWFCSTNGQEFQYFQQTDYNEIKYLGGKSIWGIAYSINQILVNIRRKIMRSIINKIIKVPKAR